jgi:hypothetical protein
MVILIILTINFSINMKKKKKNLWICKFHIILLSCDIPSRTNKILYNL